MSSKSTFSNSTSKSYATALFELSRESSEQKAVEDGIKGLDILLKENFNFKQTISNPAIRKEDKMNVMLAIANQNNFSKILRNFLGIVAIKNRLFFLDKIVESFLNLVSKNKGELKAKIISSKKLSIDEQKKIELELSKNFQSKLKIHYEYDPNLIGGLIIQVGSIMVDASIKTKLKKIEKTMLET